MGKETNKIQPITASQTASHPVAIGRSMPSHRASFIDNVFSFLKNNIRFGNDIDPKLESKSHWGCVNPKIYAAQKPVIKPIPSHTTTSSIEIGVRGKGYGVRGKGTEDRGPGTEGTKGKTTELKEDRHARTIPVKTAKHQRAVHTRAHKSARIIPVKTVRGGEDTHVRALPQQIQKKETASSTSIIPKPLKSEWAIGYPGGPYSLGILPIKDDSRIEISLFANESEMKMHKSANVEAGLLSYILYNGNSNLTGKLPIRTLEYKTLALLEFNDQKNVLNLIASSTITNNWKAELALTSDGRLSARFARSEGNLVYTINAGFETKQIEYDPKINFRILKTFQSENDKKIFFGIDDSLQIYTGVMEKDDKIKSLLTYRF